MQRASKLLIGLTAFFAACLVSYFAAQRPVKGAAQRQGRIPQGAFKADGSVDLDLVPDFVVAYRRDGAVAGYVSKQDIFRQTPSTERQRPLSADVPVLDESLDQVVGHMIAGRGFVPRGNRPDDIPSFAGVELAP